MALRCSLDKLLFQPRSLNWEVMMTIKCSNSKALTEFGGNARNASWNANLPQLKVNLSGLGTCIPGLKSWSYSTYMSLWMGWGGGGTTITWMLFIYGCSLQEWMPIVRKRCCRGYICDWPWLLCSWQQAGVFLMCILHFSTPLMKDPAICEVHTPRVDQIHVKYS